MALVASIVYMYKQVTAYKDDMAHYQVLKGDEEESINFGMTNTGQGITV